jgi:hypothetical protein
LDVGARCQTRQFRGMLAVERDVQPVRLTSHSTAVYTKRHESCRPEAVLSNRNEESGSRRPLLVT